ncbi:protein of unknown function [Legionella micdadei]|uniref:Uncharacterized protein n=1 Tax=Legionella micdadei TaxID=451 RepID=A0A098GFY2_LEGMI|nr:protein of unknown function [Legionella micdadei]
MFHNHYKKVKFLYKRGSYTPKNWLYLLLIMKVENRNSKRVNEWYSDWSQSRIDPLNISLCQKPKISRVLIFI